MVVVLVEFDSCFVSLHRFLFYLFDLFGEKVEDF
jgi:hypothetical protein